MCTGTYVRNRGISLRISLISGERVETLHIIMLLYLQISMKLSVDTSIEVITFVRTQKRTSLKIYRGRGILEEDSRKRSCKAKDDPAHVEYGNLNSVCYSTGDFKRHQIRISNRVRAKGGAKEDCKLSENYEEFGGGEYEN